MSSVVSQVCVILSNLFRIIAVFVELVKNTENILIFAILKKEYKKKLAWHQKNVQNLGTG